MNTSHIETRGAEAAVDQAEQQLAAAKARRKAQRKADRKAKAKAAEKARLYAAGIAALEYVAARGSSDAITAAELLIRESLR